MNKFYFFFALAALSLFTLTSCSSRYRFVTQGLPEKDSSYLVTNEGKRIDAQKIIVKPGKLKVDGKNYSTNDLSAIKSKKMYLVVSGDKLYQCDVYGKINLLYTLSYTYYYNSGPGPGRTDVTKSYYLQKQGSKEIDEFTKATFFEYLADNPEALSRAKAHYIWHYASYATFVTGAASFVYLVASVNSNSTFTSLEKPIGFMVGGVILHVVVSDIADHKIRNAIKIYNATAE